MKKQASRILIVLICLSIVIALFVYNDFEKEKKARLEAERKEFLTLWDQIEVFMSIEDFLKLYPEAIKQTGKSTARLAYYQLPSPRIIANNSYTVVFQFSDNTIDKVTLRLEDELAKSCRLPDYAYNLYQSLTLKYGSPNKRYSESDFGRNRTILCHWEHNLAKIHFGFLYSSEASFLTVSYSVNHELLQAYFAQQEL
jgi:hypothetical protein